MANQPESVQTDWDRIPAGTLVVNDKGQFGVVAKTLDGKPIVIHVYANLEGWVVGSVSGNKEV